jgi:hypothetical protein
MDLYAECSIAFWLQKERFRDRYYVPRIAGTSDHTPPALDPICGE